MWRFLILLCTAFLAESQKVDYMQLLFGDQLSIKLSLYESLEFTSVDESDTYSIWAFSLSSKRGSTKGSKSNRRYVINHVSFEDEGTYTRRNVVKTVNYVAKVKVFAKRTGWSCVRGETCNIKLNGIEKDKASLRFSNEDVNVMLVVKGVIQKDLPDYIDRIKVTSSSIQVLNFNVSDAGNYTLYDGQNRKAVTTRMHFSEPHGGIDASPLLSLLLLFLIPIGGCCCRKRIFKKKSNQATAMTSIVSQSVVSPPGPPPDYYNHVDPAGPGQMYTPGYPAPGDSQVHPPPPAANPAYPPLPQYSAQPAMPHNPGFTPVMYNYPADSGTEGNKEEMKRNEMFPSAPLLGPSLTEVGPPPPPYTGMDVLNSNSSTAHFNSSRYNFL